MNIISHCTAYSFFPKSTFKDKITVVLNLRQRNHERHMHAVSKLPPRGFDVHLMYPTHLMLDVQSELNITCACYPGDAFTWLQEIEYRGSLFSRPDFLRCNSFDMQCETNTNAPETIPIMPASTGYNFVIAPSEMRAFK